MDKSSAISDHKICKLLLKKIFFFDIYKNVRPKKNRKSNNSNT